LDLRHTLHLNVELLVDVVEMGHDHIEDIVFMKRARDAFWALPSWRPDLAASPERARRSAWALWASRPGGAAWSWSSPFSLLAPWPAVSRPTPRHAPLRILRGVPTVGRKSNVRSRLCWRLRLRRSGASGRAIRWGAPSGVRSAPCQRADPGLRKRALRG
jgi:hypothetical protein